MVGPEGSAMRLVWVLAGMAFGLAGCSTAVDERFQDYNADGVQLFRQGNFGDAQESFQAALALKPEDPAVLFNLGECYARLGDGARAEQRYHDCLQRAPNHVPCRHALALLLVQQNRQAEAGKMIEEWMAHEPKLAAAYAEDGWFWRHAGDLPRAQARLQQALEFDPHDSRGLTELAQIYETMQRPERALALYERALEFTPNQPDLTNRINALLAKGAGRPRPD
jgi:Flp pilus assembly protein TadD